MTLRNDLSFYDAVAPEWWEQTAKIYALYHLNAPRFAYFDRFISQWDSLSVLDVGCGGGFSCEFLAQRGAIVTGIDQSHKCIAAAQAHAAETQWAIDYRQGHAETLPYPDASFDVVVCVDVLEHVDDVSQTLTEIHRVLKPGGWFCFDTINRTFKSKLIMIWLLEDGLRQIPQGIHDWHKFIKPEELIYALQTLNFHAIEIKGFKVFGETLWDNIAAYWHYCRTGGFQINLNDDISVMYIGTAQKAI